MSLHLRIAAITAGALALTASGLGSQPRGTPEAQHIEVVASKFSFAPNEITVKKGVPVTLELISQDRHHGFESGALLPGAVS